jgi:endonuclease YncB( thermonuclease family)
MLAVGQREDRERHTIRRVRRVQQLPKRPTLRPFLRRTPRVEFAAARRLAVPRGLEPPTFGLGNRCSILLSYGTTLHSQNMTPIAYVPGAPAAFVTVALAAACCCPAVAQQQTVSPAPACGTGEVARGTVKSVIDGRTFALDDGREVRLAGIEVPPPPHDDDASPGGAAAKDALAALAAGDEVVLRRAEPEPPADRYGRIVAFAYTERDGDELFVQSELVASGFARVGDRVGSRACAADLLAREAAARAAKLGLWADPYYEILDAETPVDVLAHKGRFALVEGRVVSVRESGATIYVNFGRRWSQDFTVTVLKRNERNFAAAGLDLKSLEGRRIRVRGWIEERGGTTGGADGVPWLEAARPEQIETVDGH